MGTAAAKFATALPVKAKASMYRLLGRQSKYHKAALRLKNIFEAGVHPRTGKLLSAQVKKRMRVASRRAMIRFGSSGRASDRMSAIAIGDSPFSLGMSGSQRRRIRKMYGEIE